MGYYILSFFCFNDYIADDNSGQNVHTSSFVLW
ncbi:hypothetical protein EDF66_10523 [Sphingobacterium sp. JUb20]|nr:hypothetical protein [Sphingobacterium sp. JUb21]TCR07394.1 hypothetical protein EDF66_10523 [Sphingobacterium sp. JUb20]